jgi:hypothetical protein
MILLNYGLLIVVILTSTLVKVHQMDMVTIIIGIVVIHHIIIVDTLELIH